MFAIIVFWGGADVQSPLITIIARGTPVEVR